MTNSANMIAEMMKQSRPYVSICYRQDRKPMGLMVFVTNCGEHARVMAMESLPPWHILEAAGVTEVWLVTRELRMETWPNCHRDGCGLKACLKANSPFCYPHTEEIAGNV